MYRLLILALCVPLAAWAALAEEPEPEPEPTPDRAIQKLDEAVQKADKVGKEKVEAQHKKLVASLEKRHADLVKRGKKEQASALKARLLLAQTLKPGQGLETKLTVAKLLDKASNGGRQKELLHVLYLPTDKASYTEFRDWGMWSGASYGGHNGLSAGYWVYVYPRWYIWKE